MPWYVTYKYPEQAVIRIVPKISHKIIAIAQYLLILCITPVFFLLDATVIPFLYRITRFKKINIPQAEPNMIHLRHYTQSDIPWDLTTTTWYGSGQLGDGLYCYREAPIMPHRGGLCFRIRIEHAQWDGLKRLTILNKWSIPYIRTVATYCAEIFHLYPEVRQTLHHWEEPWDIIIAPIIGGPIFTDQQVVLRNTPATRQVWAQAEKQWETATNTPCAPPSRS